MCVPQRICVDCFCYLPSGLSKNATLPGPVFYWGRSCADVGALWHNVGGVHTVCTSTVSCLTNLPHDPLD